MKFEIRRVRNGALLRAVGAIYENGKLVLQGPLPLPEHAQVQVTVESDLERGAWLKLSDESLTKFWVYGSAYARISAPAFPWPLTAITMYCLPLCK